MYFKDKQSEYLFYLIELDGYSRMLKLGIKPVHYTGKKIATQWYEHILSIISANKNHELYNIGIKKLEGIYLRMTT